MYREPRVLPVASALLLTIICLGASSESGVAGQAAVTTIPDEVSCAQCSLTLSRVVVLGEESGAGMLAGNSIFTVRDGFGRYYVWETDVGSSVKVFNPDGTFAVAFGRRGQGPGEFQVVSAVRLLSDGRAAVFDGISRRVSFFSPTFEFIESRTLPENAGYNAVVISDNEIVAATRGTGPDSVGFPLHLMRISPTAELIRSFGSDGLMTPLSSLTREIALASLGDGVWVVDPRSPQHRLERWSIAGELTRVVEKGYDGWLPAEYEHGREEFPEIPNFPAAVPYTSALWEDDRGRLWVFTAVADPNLRSIVDATPVDRQLEASANEIRDMVVEVIDLEGAVILARARFDEPLYPIGDGLVKAVREVGSETYLEILQLTLRREGESRDSSR